MSVNHFIALFEREFGGISLCGFLATERNDKWNIFTHEERCL